MMANRYNTNDRLEIKTFVFFLVGCLVQLMIIWIISDNDNFLECLKEIPWLLLAFCSTGILVLLNRYLAFYCLIREDESARSLNWYFSGMYMFMFNILFLYIYDPDLNKLEGTDLVGLAAWLSIVQSILTRYDFQGLKKIINNEYS